MAHKISVLMNISKAKQLQRLGREVSGDNSLGIDQAAAVLLEAVLSGEFVRAEKPKPKPKKEVKEAVDSED